MGLVQLCGVSREQAPEAAFGREQGWLRSGWDLSRPLAMGQGVSVTMSGGGRGEEGKWKRKGLLRPAGP